MNSLKQLSAARKLSSLEVIELAVEEVCENLSVEGTRAYFITLAVSELASNMIRHGRSGHSVTDELTVEIHSTDTTIKVVLKDCCEPLPRVVITQLTDNDGTIRNYDTTLCNLPESGWGLDLVHSAATSVTYDRRSNRNVYEVVFDITSPVRLAEHRTYYK